MLLPGIAWMAVYRHDGRGTFTLHIAGYEGENEHAQNGMISRGSEANPFEEASILFFSFLLRLRRYDWRYFGYLFGFLGSRFG